MGKISVNELYESIKTVLSRAQSEVYRAVNTSMVTAYWSIGKLIAIEEQEGKSRADYGEYLIKNVSLRLTQDFGKGFSDSLYTVERIDMVAEKPHDFIKDPYVLAEISAPNTP